MGCFSQVYLRLGVHTRSQFCELLSSLQFVHRMRVCVYIYTMNYMKSHGASKCQEKKLCNTCPSQSAFDMRLEASGKINPKIWEGLKSMFIASIVHCIGHVMCADYVVTCDTFRSITMDEAKLPNLFSSFSLLFAKFTDFKNFSHKPAKYQRESEENFPSFSQD